MRKNLLITNDYQDPDGRTWVRQQVDDWVIQEWHEKWKSSTKDGHTPTGRQERLRKKLIPPNYYSTQFLAGRRSFRPKLQTFRLVDNADCDCNLSGADIVDHVLYHATSTSTGGHWEKGHKCMMSYGLQLSATGSLRQEEERRRREQSRGQMQLPQQ